MSKKKCNQTIVNVSMKQTFQHRRTWLTTQIIPINEILLEYPFLTEGQEILKEFERLMKFNVLERFESNFASIIEKVIEMSSNKNSSVKEYVESYGIISSGNSYYSSCVAVLALPCLLREATENYFYYQGQRNSFTQIVVSKEFDGFPDITDDEVQFTVLLEGNEIGVTNNFVEAFLILFSSFYVFDVAYPTSLNSTLTFVQKHVLCIGDCSPLSSKIISLISNLK